MNTVFKINTSIFDREIDNYENKNDITCITINGHNYKFENLLKYPNLKTINYFGRHVDIPEKILEQLNFQRVVLNYVFSLDVDNYLDDMQYQDFIEEKERLFEIIICNAFENYQDFYSDFFNI